MEWDAKTRRKLALLVHRKATSIQEEEFHKARGNLRTYHEILVEVDKRILEVLAPLGFRRANKDWEHESHTDVMLFKDSPTTLWFATAQGRVVKISKEKAEKVLVLGFP